MNLRNRLSLISALAVVCSIAADISPRASGLSPAGAADFYNVKSFGAKADGRTLDTSAINQAIDTAAAAMRLATIIIQPTTKPANSLNACSPPWLW